MFVADVAITDLPQVSEIRVELESLCVRLAVQRITREQLDELKHLVADARRQRALGPAQALRPLGSLGFMSLDRRFHRLLAEAAGNKFLQHEVEKFYNLSLRIWYLALNRIQPGDVGVDDHLEIVDAIEAQDPERGEQRMREHIRHFHDTIKLRL
jgi:DNA-binding GntR family transcriptional regulator